VKKGLAIVHPLHIAIKLAVDKADGIIQAVFRLCKNRHKNVCSLYTDVADSELDGIDHIQDISQISGNMNSQSQNTESTDTQPNTASSTTYSSYGQSQDYLTRKKEDGSRKLLDFSRKSHSLLAQ
jgi:hypothetical protein